MAHRERIHRKLTFVASAPLEALIEAYPDEWKVVGEGLVEATATHRPEALEAFARATQDAAAPHRKRVEANRNNPEVIVKALPYFVRARMAVLGAQQALQTAALGGGTGRRRFGFWSGRLVNAIFFSRGLTRKAVSMARFRLLWPWVTQKRLLMPLVQPRGIYAFYSRELILALGGLVDGRPALEIGAGDGTLARLLGQAGVAVRATDDYSWSQNIQYPAEVEKLDAVAALDRYRPTVVLCAFPPPRNPFEKVVFDTASVRTYVVITTKHQFAAGDWTAYEQQKAFTLSRPPALARLVLPPEIDPLVLVFQRSTDG
jgi:hypothetical protein